MRQLSFDDRLLPDDDDMPRPKRAKRRGPKARRPTPKAPASRLDRSLAFLAPWIAFARRQNRRTWFGVAGSVGAGAVALYLALGGLTALGEAIGTKIAAAAADAGYTVQNVYAQGRRTVPSQRVLDALAVKRGEPILAVNLNEAREHLEAIDWIQSASVERRLPDTILVRLVERQPLALWQHDGKLALIDREGAVFGRNDVTRFANLPLIVGAGAPAEAPRLFDAMAAEPALFKRVVAAIWVGGRRWNIRFDSGLEARLPEGDVEPAWARLEALVSSRDLLERPVAGVDLRIADRTLIRMRGEAIAPANDNDQNKT